MKTIEWLAEESGMDQYVSPHNKYLARFAELLEQEFKKKYNIVDVPTIKEESNEDN